MEKRFVITWTIDVSATDEQEAVQQAIKAMPTESNPASIATVFEVEEVNDKGKVVKKSTIDLLQEQD